MVTATKVITEVEVMALEAKGIVREISNGQWVEVELTGERHGRIEMNLLLQLGTFVKGNKLGRVYPGDVTFVLEGEPGNIITMCMPDVAFVSAERVQDSEGYYYQSPDLAVEIISPSERVQEIEDKLNDYLRTGVKEVWQIYPTSRQVIVYKAGGHPAIYTIDQAITTDLLPGFELKVSAIFE